MELSVEEQRTPKPFWRAIPRRTCPIGIVAALLAVAAATGTLVDEVPTPATAHTGSSAGAAGMALSTTDGVPGLHPQAAPPTAEAKAEAPKPPSEKILTYDFQYQPNFYYCAPASVHIALTTQGINLSQDELAQQLGTTVNGTNSAEDTTRVMNSVTGKDVYQTRSIPGPNGATPAEMDRLQADVVNAISNGRAVVANIVGSATDNAGFWRDFSGGHYIPIVGYSDEGRQVQVADPSGVGPATYWMSTIDMANWIATRGYSA